MSAQEREWQPGDLLSTRCAKVVPRILVQDAGYCSPCWLAQYVPDKGGYVLIRVAGKTGRLHRYVYEALVSEIPEGMELDHLCRVRHCCNPAHLEPVTPLENTMRGEGPTAVNARKTHCVHGHEFTPENTYIRPDGSRKCIACRRKDRMNHYYRSRGIA